MAEKNISSRRTKHIWIIYRFVTSWIEAGFIKPSHVDTKDNLLSDFMTKVPKDVNFISNSANLFRNIVTWSSEVVCYNTELMPVTHWLRTAQDAIGITVRAALCRG